MTSVCRYLELGLEVGDDGRRNETADAAAVDAQDCDELPRTRRWLRHRLRVGNVGRAIARHG